MLFMSYRSNHKNVIIAHCTVFIIGTDHLYAKSVELQARSTYYMVFL